jgi:hypothetical protein
MHWEVLIVPLIALGVWILGTLFRNEEDERARQRRRGNLEGGVRVPPRRPVTDLDRFLEEARRRREAAERGRGGSPPAAATEAPPRATRPPWSPERPAREGPRRPRPSPPTAPPRRPAAEVPVAIPVPRPAAPQPAAPAQAEVVRVVRVEAAPVAAMPTAESVRRADSPPPAPPAPPQPTPATPHPSRGQAMTPILTQVVALLRSPQAAGTALVLREIFDQPRCRRSHR